jgi:thioredoxin 1
MERDEEMTWKTSATASTVVQGYGRLAGRAGGRGLRLVAGFGLIALALPVGGCGGGSLMSLNGSADFQRQVLQSEKPVMVQFSKTGCTWCALLEPALAQLADDYQGRAVFAKYCLMNWLFGVTNWDLKSKYDIRWYPTVILFVNGREKQRWVAQYDIKSYRKAMDDALRVPTRPATPAPGKR